MNNSLPPNPSVHIVSATTSGGAGRAALRLRDALKAAGTDTAFSVQRHPTPATPRLGGYPLLGSPWWLSPGLSRILTTFDGQDAGIRSINYLPTGRLKHLNRTRADILNLHWLGSDTLSIAEIGRLTKPFVWTLHDMWAFCGTEHLAPSDDLARWRHGYPKKESWFDLDRWVWQHKRKHFPRQGFAVCPSDWLSSCVRKSVLLREWDVQTIANPINTTVYAPRNRHSARAELGLDPKEKILLFGAHGADSDPNKGFDLVQDMMGHLATRQTDEQLRCLIFGNEQPGPMNFNGLPATYLGRLTSDQELVTAYCAADIVIVPSRQENLPQVATEAQSCGRAVAAFNTSGLKDAIIDGETGILIPAYDTKRGADLLLDLIKDQSRLSMMETTARARAARTWSPSVIAGKYNEYFQRVLAMHGR